MRRYLLSFSMILAAAFAGAQGQKGPSPSFAMSQDVKVTSATLTTFDNQPAVMVVVPYSPATVMSAMEEYQINCFRRQKKQSTAYVAFDKTVLIQNNTKDASLIFKVGQADLQRQDQSVVYLLLNTPIEKGDHAGTVHRFNTSDAVAYLDNLAVAIQDINLDRQIKANMASLKKEENKQAKCAKRCDRLSDRKTAIQQSLAQNKRSAVNRDKRIDRRLTENQNALSLYKATIEKQRADLAQLTSQKKNIHNKRG